MVEFIVLAIIVLTIILTWWYWQSSLPSGERPRGDSYVEEKPPRALEEMPLPSGGLPSGGLPSGGLPSGGRELQTPWLSWVRRERDLVPSMWFIGNENPIKWNTHSLLKLTIQEESSIKYWEYDIYSAPDWELKEVIPLQRQIVLGAPPFQLEEGSYFIVLRALGGSGRNFKGVQWLTSNSLNPDVVEDTVSLGTVDDRHRYAEVGRIYTELAPTILQEGFYLQASSKSEDTLDISQSPLIHTEKLIVSLNENQVLLLIYLDHEDACYEELRLVAGKEVQVLTGSEERSRSPKHLTIGPNLNITLYITQMVCGVNPDSQFLPLYAYIFSRDYPKEQLLD